MMAIFSSFDSPRVAFREALHHGKFARLRTSNPKPRRKRRALLIHYHIFKNAGTSFEYALKKAFGKGIRSYDTPFHDGFLSRRDIAAYVQQNQKAKVIFTHQAAPPAPRVKGCQVLTSILIRDPIARIRSIYLFERSQPSDGPGPTRAKESDFKSYVQWRLEVSPTMFCNFQVMFCNRRRPGNPLPPDPFDLERAIAALDDMEIVGTVERYDEWLALAQSILTEHFDSMALEAVRLNQLVDGSVRSEAATLRYLVGELGEELASQLLERNELDMSLHQVADALLTRRLAERSVAIKLRDTYGGAAQDGEAMLNPRISPKPS